MSLASRPHNSIEQSSFLVRQEGGQLGWPPEEENVTTLFFVKKMAENVNSNPIPQRKV